MVKNRILRYLNKAGISQPKLALAIGVTVNTVNNWCCNRSQPKLTNIEAIGSYLGVDPHKLIRFHPYEEPKKVVKKKKKLNEKEAMDKAFLASIKKTKKNKKH